FSDNAGKIIGCEIVPEAIENAKRNAELNGVKNAEFYCGDAGKLSQKLADEGIVPDVAVIDPPRKGCDKLTLDSLLRMSPNRIVMISCNPATAARDAKYLAENGYEVKKARAFDLFPRTGHVETVVLLSKG
ncbi:MAG: methyltransferase domain-containing protein, partial [Oscillospiraceae bacterium]|nr:methyltransferase domain-containing protein [Oscillospiraceae bacterium]